MYGTVELERELAVAERLAREAGDAIIQIRDRAILSVTTKSDNSPVTEADLLGDTIIRSGLTQAFPYDVIVTEETWSDKETLPGTGRVWICDPLDGTKEFVRGTVDWAVLIGMCIDGKPRLGVVYHPDTGVIWRGLIRSDGTTKAERIGRDGVPVKLPAFNPPISPQGVRLGVSAWRSPSTVQAFLLQALSETTPIPQETMSLKVLLVAEGHLDLYLTPEKACIWDSCAPFAVLLAAGGSVVCYGGEPLEQYSNMVLHSKGFRAASKAFERVHGSVLNKRMQLWEERRLHAND